MNHLLYAPRAREGQLKTSPIIIIIIKRKLKAQINRKNVTNAPR